MSRRVRARRRGPLVCGVAILALLGFGVPAGALPAAKSPKPLTEVQLQAIDYAGALPDVTELQSLMPSHGAGRPNPPASLGTAGVGAWGIGSCSTPLATPPVAGSQQQTSFGTSTDFRALVAQVAGFPASGATEALETIGDRASTCTSFSSGALTATAAPGKVPTLPKKLRNSEIAVFDLTNAGRPIGEIWVHWNARDQFTGHVAMTAGLGRVVPDEFVAVADTVDDNLKVLAAAAAKERKNTKGTKASGK
jgi:hypothetical protein